MLYYCILIRLENTTFYERKSVNNQIYNTRMLTYIFTSHVKELNNEIYGLERKIKPCKINDISYRPPSSPPLLNFVIDRSPKLSH